MSSIKNVFGVPELLEMILVNVPATELLRLQRVSKSWRDCINSSSTIGTTLFFKADLHEKGNTATTLKWNLYFMHYGNNHPDHPYCCRKFNARDLQESKRKKESWRKMHITKPSNTSIRVFRYGEPFGITSFSRRLTNKDGVKLGQLCNVPFINVPWDEYELKSIWLSLCVEVHVEIYGGDCR